MSVKQKPISIFFWLFEFQAVKYTLANPIFKHETDFSKNRIA